MKAINGKLDMSKSYKLVSIHYGELSSGDGSACDNCGQIIKNIAIVEDNTGKQSGIGLDCLMTIINMSPDDKQQAKNIINRRRKFIKELKFAERIDIGKKHIVFWFYTRGDDNQLHIRGKGDYELYKDLINSLNVPVIQLAE